MLIEQGSNGKRDPLEQLQLQLQLQQQREEELENRRSPISLNRRADRKLAYSETSPFPTCSCSSFPPFFLFVVNLRAAVLV